MGESLNAAKAALKRTHSRRFARNASLGIARQRLECVRFSAAFERVRNYEGLNSEMSDTERQVISRFDVEN